jgi:hypothetical protein
MVKEHFITKMVVLNMKEIFSMIKYKEMENIYMKMENII